VSVPATAQPLPGGRPLDPERPASDPARPAPEPSEGPAGERPDGAAPPGAGVSPDDGARPAAGTPRATRPPGLRAQLGATRTAALGLAQAHIDLVRAEVDEIKGEVARASGLAAAAIACLILLAFFVPIGGLLFAGEWIFGSIGWGLLLGTELLIAVAVTVILVALRVPGLGRDVIVALLLGFAVALVLGLNLPNELFRRIGEAAGLAVDPAVLPLVVGVAVVGVIGALTGLAIGIRRRGGAGGILGGLVAGMALGALAGAFLSITFGLRVGVALGVAAFLVAWPVLMGLRTQRQGIDPEELKARFYPQATIDTAKESIEWAKARASREPRS